MKKATLALAGLVVIGSAAEASMSRWNGFGVAQAFIADVQDIWTLPAVTATKKDTTYFEFGATAGNPTSAGSTAYNGLVAAGQAWGGAHGQLGPGVLAIWANRPYGEFSNLGNLVGGYAAPVFTGTNGTPAAGLAIAGVLTNQIDVLYGFSLSDTVDLGIGISRATGGVKTETTTTVGTAVAETQGSDLGVNLGADLKNVGPVALLEIGLQYNMRSDTNTNKTATGFSNKNTLSGSDIDLRVGGDMTGEGGEFSRFEVQFNSDGVEFKSEADGFTPSATTYSALKRSGMGWGLGYAMGKSNDKGMGLGGLILSGGSTGNEAAYSGQNMVTGGALGYFAEKNKSDSSTMSIMFVSAGEVKAKDWLSLRAGLSTSLYTSTSTTYEVSTAAGAGAPTAKVVTTSGTAAPNATVTTGASIHLGDITIDGLLNQDFLYTWGHVVSGIAAAPFAQVSATWAWGGAKE
jgi:hypothetical protein